MSDSTIFYILGGALVVSALLVAAVGLRKEDFPSPRAIRGILPLFAALVIATMTFAVLNANSEKDKTDHNREAAAKLDQANLAASEAAADDPDSTAPVAAQPTPTPAPSAATGPAEKLAITSPATGALSFSPGTLSAKAGEVEIDYDNPSVVPHSIAIADASGAVLDQVDPQTKTTMSVSANLKAGTYTYYCTVPGHREAGMQGTLVVK